MFDPESQINHPGLASSIWQVILACEIKMPAARMHLAGGRNVIEVRYERSGPRARARGA